MIGEANTYYTEIDYYNNIVYRIIPSNPPTSLQCVTDRQPCCRYLLHGEWIFPNGSHVSVLGSGATIYRTRGHDGTVSLNRRKDSGLSVGGLFCCIVPDAVGIEQTLCANVGM